MGEGSGLGGGLKVESSTKSASNLWAVEGGSLEGDAGGCGLSAPPSFFLSIIWSSSNMSSSDISTATWGLAFGTTPTLES